MIRTLPKVAIGILLAGTLGLSPLVAGADSSSTTTTQATTVTTPSTWATFRVSWQAYVNGLRAIDTTYRASVQSARRTYRISMRHATTYSERQAAKAALDTSIAAALNVRVVAIVAAGNPPTPPAGFNGTAWVTGFQAANIAFRAAKVSAQTALAAALAAATNNVQREVARLTFRSAIDAAEAAHLSALATLGPPPVKRGTPTTTTTIKVPSAWATFRISWQTYVNGLKATDAAYQASVKSARATYQASLLVATTSVERQAAKVALDASLASALNVRVAAIIAGGLPPAPPAGFNGTAWVTGFQAANVTFRAAVIAAQSAYATALSVATTHAQREVARLTFQGAVDSAQAVHVSALATLGAPPKNPGKAS